MFGSLRSNAHGLASQIAATAAARSLCYAFHSPSPLRFPPCPQVDNNLNIDSNGLGNGGGIALYTAGTPAGVAESVTFRNCLILRNVATGGFGGGLNFMSADGQPTSIGIYNSELAENRAVSGAGFSLSSASINITVQDSLFRWNHASSSGGGAAAYIGVATFIRTRFIQNSVGTGSGGGVRVKSWMVLTFRDCTFEANRAVDIGGAIAIAMYTMLRVSGSRFVNNFANNGVRALLAADALLQTQIGPQIVREVVSFLRPRFGLLQLPRA